MNQRASQDGLIARVTNGQSLVRCDHFASEFISNGLVHDEAAHSGATLSCGTSGCEDDTAQCEIDVCRRSCDTGVVAAARLKEVAAKARGNTRRNFVTHAGRTGGGNQSDTLVINQHLTDFAVTQNQLVDVWDPRRTPLLPCAAASARRWRRTHRFRKASDDGVAADQRDGGVPGIDRYREVERRDNTDDADWMPGLHQAVAWTLRRHGLAEEHSGLTESVVADVNHLLHLTLRFRHGLARFNLYESRKVTLVLCKQLTPALNHIAALRC